MENKIYNEQLNNSMKRLAMIDLMVGVLPTTLFLIWMSLQFETVMLHMFYLNFMWPAFIVNLVFGVISYRYLSKMKLKGVNISILSKIISIVILTIFVLNTFLSNSYFWWPVDLITLFVNIFLFILIRYALSIENRWHEARQNR